VGEAMSLVDDAKNFWKWLSTWVLALAGIVGTAWEVFPPFQAYIEAHASPSDHFGKYLIGFALLAFIARIIKQTETQPPK